MTVKFEQGKYYKDTLHNVKVMFCAEMVTISTMNTSYEFWNCQTNVPIRYTKDTIKYISEWTEPMTGYKTATVYSSEECTTTTTRTLRDEIAMAYDVTGEMLKTYIDHVYRQVPDRKHEVSYNDILRYTAKIKYRYSDAMMKQREIKE